MEPTLWARFIGFVKESYLYRLKETFAGIFMGFGISKHLLFAGQLANLVGGWWLIKAIGSLILAFVTSLLTSYAGVLVKRWTDPEKKSQRKEKRKNKKAA